MSTTPIGSRPLSPLAAVGSNAAANADARPALALLVKGAVETTDAVRREATFVERQVPAPFSDDKVDIRAAAQEAASVKAEQIGQPAQQPPQIRQTAPTEQAKASADARKLSLTGQPVAEKAEAAQARGNLVDIET